jgi:hypothetical protein
VMQHGGMHRDSGAFAAIHGRIRRIFASQV